MVTNVLVIFFGHTGECNGRRYLCSLRTEETQRFLDRGIKQLAQGRIGESGTCAGLPVIAPRCAVFYRGGIRTVWKLAAKFL